MLYIDRKGVEDTLKKVFRALVTIVGAALGPGVVLLVYAVLKNYFEMDLQTALQPWANMLILVVSFLIFGIIFVFISLPIVDGLTKLIENIEKKAAENSVKVVLISVGGLLIGLFAAFLISNILSGVSIVWLTVPVNLLVYAICGYTALRVAALCAKKVMGRKRGGESSSARSNILDTSAVIDGRIFDICKTGIIEGKIVIPCFVLDELRHIADSADSLKRSKGRRGLDILGRIQKELDMSVEVTDTDYDDIAEVDAKLLRMAEATGGRVITNDFNLNKVASVRGVVVFNINDLANAIKPVLVAGESLTVSVIKEGKEFSQGVAYLEDGTMIVVENGRKYIGEAVNVEVTSILQTSAGRMIFAKPAD